jgi:uncharacterized damage-inducible protein DinB
MTTEERATLVQRLRDTRDELLAAVGGIDEDRAAARQQDRWSVRDCVEHLAITERGMLRMVQTAQPAGSVADRSRAEAAILDHGADRTRKATAPANALPTGRYETLAQAMDRFEEARARTIAFVEQCDYDLRSRVLDHPVSGRITALECLLLIVQHPRRHAAQIREMRGLTAASS